MLAELTVANLLIVNQARLRPGQGLCAITGETGAGKSLLLDALSLLLGARASASLVGPSGDSCTVTGVVEVDAALAASLAERFGIDGDEGQVILRRRVQRSGRSQCWVNDVPVSVKTMRAVASELVEVRLQHEHVRMSDVARQLHLVDAFGGHQALATSYGDAHRACLDASAALVALQDDDRDSLRERDFLRFLADEIAELDPQPGQLAALEQRQQVLASAGDWQALAAEATALLSEGDDPIGPQLTALASRLVEAPIPALADAGQALTQAGDLVNEAAMAASGCADGIETDPAELERIDSDLARWYDLMRKHGGHEAALLQARTDITTRLADLEGIDQRRADASAALAAAERERDQLGAKLAKARTKAFAGLAEAVHAELIELGMPKARLSLSHEPTAKPGPLGTVDQQIHVQTNPGLAADRLAAVASGGETARIILALSVVLADQLGTPVIVFDEIDAGVGGRLGGAMGAKLARLARGRSVVVVTHTPQLAAHAHQHLVVAKAQHDDTTEVTVNQLTGAARVDEVCAMLGGGPAALSQAQALLAEVSDEDE